MAKRFISTDTFDDEWYSELSQDAKIFWIYYITKCDHAGILKLNKRLAKFQTGVNSIERVIKELGNRLVTLSNDTFFCPKFLIHQYPKFPQSKVRAQDSALKILNFYGITIEKINEYLNPLIRVNKDLVKDYDNDNDNDNENEIEKEKGGVGEKEKTNLPARMKPAEIIQMSVTENTSSHELIDMQNKLPKGSAKKMSEIFLQMLQSTGELQKHNPDDLGRYFYNWANYHAKRMRSLFQNEENRAEIVSDYFTRSDEKQNPDEMLKSLHAYLK